MTAHAGYYGPELLLDGAGRPLRLANVVILQADATTPAVLYTDRSKTATLPSNAVQTDNGGNLAFYADPGQYVLRWTVAGVTHTLTVEVGQDFTDQGGAVLSVNGHTGVVTLAAADVGADASGAAASAVTTHTAAPDPHGDRAYTDTQVATRAAATALTTETTRATAAEQANATAIASETTRAQAAEAAISAGLQFKAARVVATSNVASRSGLPTFDGVTLSSGDLVLLVAQSSGSQNGLWKVASGAWTRPSNYAAGSDASAVSVWVEDGTVNKSSVWVVAGSPPNVVDTNVTTWQQASGLGEVIAGTGIVKTGSTLSTDPAVIATVAALAGVQAGALSLVVHGATGSTARPAGATQVLWIGTATPTNATTNDLWYDTGNELLKRWNGTVWKTAGSAAYIASGTQVADAPGLGLYFPEAHGAKGDGTTDDTTAINAAITAANAAGGGTVLFRPVTYKALGVTHKGGVSLVGTPPSSTQSEQHAGVYLPDGLPTYAGGTRLLGDGTTEGISAGTTPAGSPDANTFGATQIAGANVKNLWLENYTKGIHIGATNVMGLVWAEVDQITTLNCGWGVYFVNYQHVRFGLIQTFASTAGNNGQYYGTDLPGTTLADGNSQFHALFHFGANGDLNGRGIVWEALGTAAKAGQIDIFRAQVNVFNRVQVSQTATFTNTSADIAVTDGTKFPVGMPVYFSSNGAGFTTQKVYVVTYQSGNTIRLANAKSTANLTANASTTATIKTDGMFQAEFASPVASGVITGVIHNLDLEGNSSASLYVENASGTQVGVSSAQGTCALVGRNSPYVRWHNLGSGAMVTDFDAGCANGGWFDGSRSTFWGYPLAGVWKDGAAGATGVLSISQGANQNSGGDIETRAQNLLYPTLAGYGAKCSAFTASAVTLTGANSGSVVLSGSNTITLTLPDAVYDTTPGNSHIGVEYVIFNHSTNTATVSTGASATKIGLSTTTSFTILSGASAIVRCVKNGAGTMYWEAVALGTMVA